MSIATRRSEVLLLPECLDDYVSADNPVRALDLFVESLDLLKLGFAVHQFNIGRPVEYSDKMLLKLLIYGYLNQIRSSRKLERETKRNLEVIWLTEKAQPDHWTINEFRKKNSDAFKNVLRKFHKVCDLLNLFGKELEAIDGSFFKARNSMANNYTQAKLKRIEEKIDKAIEDFDSAFDSGEAESSTPAEAVTTGSNPATSPSSGSQTPPEPAPNQSSLFSEEDYGASNDPSEDASSAGQKESAEPAGVAEIKNLRAEGTLDELKEKKRRIAELKNAAKQSPSGQISLVDRDSRLLKKGNKSVVGHNVQCAVDGANTLISHIEIVQAGSDGDQIEAMAVAACEALGVEPSPENPIDALADGGYFNSAQISRLEAAGIRVHIPAPDRSKVKTPGYTLDDFTRDPATDTYICPEGKQLHRHKDQAGKGMNYHVYYNTAACKQCPVREQCTKGQYRKIQVSEHREIEQAVARRLVDEPQIYAKRKQLAELPFGLMKSIWGYEQFMLSGHKGCNGELNLMGFCFNWMRVLNLVGMERLMEAIIACLVQIGRIFSLYRAISGASHFRRNFQSQIAAA